jgi:hypothetical protein
MLFIEGKAGSGKSTLTRFFRDTLVSDRRNPKSEIVADFFYSARDGKLHQSHEMMLRSLLYHILETNESCFVHFQETYRNLPQPDSESRIKWPYESLKQILRKCSKQLRSKLILVVDALDESDDGDRRDIVELLWNLAERKDGNCVKICLTSRPIIGLPKSFYSDPRCYHLKLQEKNKQDIEKYTQSFLGNLHLTYKGIAEAKKYIIDHAEGVFVWVHLIEKDLKYHSENGCSQEELMGILKKLPTTLEKYYESMLRELKDNKEPYIEYGKRILQFCLFSQRPIGLAELHQALAIPSNKLQGFTATLDYLEHNMSGNIYALVTKAVGHFIEIKKIPKYDST